MGRTTSSGGDAGAAVEMHVVEAQADLSLSLSHVKHWNVLEVKKKIKEGGIEIGVDTGHLCGGEKKKKK